MNTSKIQLLIAMILLLALPTASDAATMGGELSDITIEGIAFCGNGCKIQYLLNKNPEDKFEHIFLTGTSSSALSKIVPFI